MIVLNREVGEALRRDKYVNVRGGDFNLYGHFGDFVRLTKSWDNMEPDSYYGQAESGMRFAVTATSNTTPRPASSSSSNIGLISSPRPTTATSAGWSGTSRISPTK